MSCVCVAHGSSVAGGFCRAIVALAKRAKANGMLIVTLIAALSP
jgi:hypothetical protein